eukprot:snap_masked-scaffold_10-processed-gene-9.32-mRNA-1 protein AED:0.04 eAED:0.05 QI:0/0/0/0.5/1/1/2/0/877
MKAALSQFRQKHAIIKQELMCSFSTTQIPKILTDSSVSKQYLKVKEKYPGWIILFQLGGFYELFQRDALVASNILDIRLGDRNLGDLPNQPFTGFPVHVLDKHLTSLVSAGHKVCLVDQEEFSNAGKILTRKISDLITPGLFFDSSDNLQVSSNLGKLVSISACNEKKRHFGLSFYSVDSDRVEIFEVEDFGLKSLVGKLNPAEIVLFDHPSFSEWINSNSIEQSETNFSGHNFVADEKFSSPCLVTKINPNNFDNLQADFPKEAFQEIEKTLAEQPNLSTVQQNSLNGLLNYLFALNVKEFPVIRSLEVMESSSAAIRHRQMAFGTSSFHMLDLFPKIRTRYVGTYEEMPSGKEKNNLFDLLNKCQTLPGRDLFLRRLSNPVVNVSEMEKRYDSISLILDEQLYLFGAELSRRNLEQFVNSLKSKGHPRKILRLLHTEKRNVKHLLNLEVWMKSCLELAAGLEVKNLEKESDISLALRKLSLLAGRIDLKKLYKNIFLSLDVKQQILINPKLERKKNKLAKLKENVDDHAGYIGKTLPVNLKWDKNQTPRLSVKKTKILKQKVEELGLIEIKTLKHDIYYSTSVLNELHMQILKLNYELENEEEDFFRLLVEEILQLEGPLLDLCEAVAIIDVTLSNAKNAESYRLVRPEPLERKQNYLEMKNSIHLLVENSQGTSVPNDLSLQSERKTICFLTGVNQGGKSTFLKSVAQNFVLAQSGSFVPATKFKFTPVDAVFTRMGSFDDLINSKSTFFVEMEEMGHALKGATQESLVLFDEVGRGTSTSDGLAISFGSLKHLISEIGCRTLFATHLQELPDMLPKKMRDKCSFLKLEMVNNVFTYKLQPGVSEGSEGIYTAETADVPENVIHGAKEFAKKRR